LEQRRRKQQLRNDPRWCGIRFDQYTSGSGARGWIGEPLPSVGWGGLFSSNGPKPPAWIGKRIGELRNPSAMAGTQGEIASREGRRLFFSNLERAGAIRPSLHVHYQAVARILFALVKGREDEQLAMNKRREPLQMARPSSCHLFSVVYAKGK
jgi:hypothetical protein